MEGKQFREITEEFRAKFIYVFAADCLIWVPMQSLNFYFVPPQQRILFISCVFVVWNTILSYFKHKVRTVFSAEIPESHLEPDKPSLQPISKICVAFKPSE